MEQPEAVAKAPAPSFTTVRVKAEGVGPGSNDGSDKDNSHKVDDNDDNGGDVSGNDGDRSRNSEKSQAERIYDRSLKILKFKLYFEDFFPTDDDRSALVYDCWMAGAKVTKGVNSDHATLEWMFYHFGYDKMVGKPPLPSPPPPF